MIREKLGRVFSSKIFYIVFSVFVAFILWMYVEINENQIQEHTVAGVPVKLLNEELLNDRELLVAGMNPETVTLTFDCPRSVVQRLTNTTLSVVVDLAGITSRGNEMIGYAIEYPSGLDTSMTTFKSSNISRISLHIDRLVSRTVNVNVTYRGGVAEGFIQEPVEFGPQNIIVSGPADAVSQVSRVLVNITERENLSSTYTDEFDFMLLDENGEELEESLRDQLTLSDDIIHVTIPIRMMKEVALTVELSPGAGATSQNTTVTYEPQTIMIAGDPDDARDYNNIVLGTMDLASFEQSRTFDYQIVIPNHFTKISGESVASVFFEVHGLEIRHFSVSNIQVVNEPPGVTVDIRSLSIDVRIRGRAEDMENLTESNIRVVADLADLGPGVQRVPARIHVDGIDADIGAVGNYFVFVAIPRE